MVLHLSHLTSMEVSVALEKARNLYQLHGGEDGQGNPRLCLVAGDPFKVSLAYLTYCTTIEAMQKEVDESETYDWIDLISVARFMPATFDDLYNSSSKFLPDVKDPFLKARSTESSQQSQASNQDSDIQS